MVAGNPDGLSMEKAPGLDATEHSFHGRLLDRSQTCLPDRKRDRLASAVRRVPWLRQLVWACWIIGVAAVFGGGLAIGAGIMQLRGDGFLKAAKFLKEHRDYVMSFGVSCIALSAIAQYLAWYGSKQLAESTKGEADRSPRNPRKRLPVREGLV